MLLNGSGLKVDHCNHVQLLKFFVPFNCNFSFLLLGVQNVGEWFIIQVHFLILNIRAFEVVKVKAEVIFGENSFSINCNIGVRHLALLLLSEYTARSVSLLRLSFTFLGVCALCQNGVCQFNLIEQLKFFTCCFWRVLWEQ